MGRPPSWTTRVVVDRAIKSRQRVANKWTWLWKQRTHHVVETNAPPLEEDLTGKCADDGEPELEEEQQGKDINRQMLTDWLIYIYRLIDMYRLIDIDRLHHSAED